MATGLLSLLCLSRSVLYFLKGSASALPTSGPQCRVPCSKQECFLSLIESSILLEKERVVTLLSTAPARHPHKHDTKNKIVEHLII